MPSRFETAFHNRATQAANRAFGVTVMLSRGVLVTDEFTARRSDVQHSALGQEYGLSVRVLMRDFLLPADALVLDGNTIEPQKGDKITEGDEVFQIQPPDENTPAVEKQPGGYEWLVHTKRIE